MICLDIDECLDLEICGDNERCINIPGSYECTTQIGVYDDTLLLDLKKRIVISATIQPLYSNCCWIPKI